MKLISLTVAAFVITGVSLVLNVTLGMSTEVVTTDRHLMRYESGVVYDTKSGLEWYLGPDKGVDWKEAITWVTSLEADGGGWRMPTRKELKTLYHLGDGVTNITHLLRNTGYWMWAGQTKALSTKWIFSFSYGGEGWSGQPPSDGGRALAVRVRKLN